MARLIQMSFHVHYLLENPSYLIWQTVTSNLFAWHYLLNQYACHLILEGHQSDHRQVLIQLICLSLNFYFTAHSFLVSITQLSFYIKDHQMAVLRPSFDFRNFVGILHALLVIIIDHVYVFLERIDYCTWANHYFQFSIFWCAC